MFKQDLYLITRPVFLLLIIFLLVQAFMPSAKAALQTTCSTTSNRSDGLVVTSRIEGSFGTSGACVIDPAKAPHLPFKIPTYGELKSLYYDQKKDNQFITKHPNSDLMPTDYDKSYLTPEGTGSDGGLYYIKGNLTLDGISGTKTKIVFVEQDLIIEGNIIYDAGRPNAGLVFVVKGNVIIEPTVTQIDAIIISQGRIYTAGENCIKSQVTTRAPNQAIEPLTINGNLVSLNMNPGSIKFCRLVTTAGADLCSAGADPVEALIAGEIVNHQPKYLVILRNIFSDTFFKWSEVQ